MVRQQISKCLRSFFVVSALLCAFAMVMPVCYADAAPERTLRVGLASDPESLDPYMQLSGTMIEYSHWVFDPLVRWEGKTIVPRLATRWEQIDVNTMRFHLRQDVKFHSGNAFTADDVVWTFERIQRSIDFKGLYEGMSIKKIDDYTFDFITAEPYGLVLNVATYVFPMDSKFYTGTDDRGIDKGLVAKTGYAYANNNASGTGPFSVVTRKQGVEIVLKANPNYWGSHGNVDNLIIRPYSTEATRVNTFLQGSLDIISPVPVQDIARLSKNNKVELISMPSTRVVTFQLNQAANDILKNQKVREALIAGTDTKAMVAGIMRGTTKTLDQVAPEGFLGHIEGLKPVYDPEAAKKLLAEAGYEKGLSLVMIAPNNRYVNDEKIAIAFVGMMQRIGVTVHLKTMPKAQYWDEYDKRGSDIQMVAWHPDTEDAANYFEYLAVCLDNATGKGQYNANGYCNKELDALVAASNTETDPVKRNELLTKATQIVLNDAVYIPLYLEPLTWAANNNVTNLKDVVNAQDSLFLGDVIMK